MRVLITGGTGSVGRAVVDLCVAQGWEARVIGRRSDMDIPGAEYRSCDITNFNDVREAIRDCQLVVHLAAIPSPMRFPGPDVFQINVSGTYNVFEAAAAEGISRVVQASSINSFGCFWGTVDIRPQYLPVDEAHPTFTTDVYSFSKNVIESIGDYYWRRDGISSLALRLPGVRSWEQISGDDARQRRQHMQTLVAEFAAQSEAEQAARLAAIRAATVKFRQQRQMEYPQSKDGFQLEGFSDDPLWRAYALDRFNFWAYVDNRDSAQSIVKGLTADYEGSHILFINAADNSLNIDSKTLARLFFPEVTEFKSDLAGTETLVSIEKARQLIGYEPEYAVSDLD